MKVGHLVVRDTLSICQFFSKRLEFLKDDNNVEKDKPNESIIKASTANVSIATDRRKQN